jgi:hypothetical protein
MKNILLSTLFVGSSLLVSAQKKQVIQAATPPANYLQLVKDVTPQLTTWRRHFHEKKQLYATKATFAHRYIPILENIKESSQLEANNKHLLIAYSQI